MRILSDVLFVYLIKEWLNFARGGYAMNKMNTKNSEGQRVLEWASLHASLYRYCLVLTGSEWDAADLSQTTWSKAIQRLQIKGHENPEAFLFRTAKNSWIDDCRRKASYKELLDGIIRSCQQGAQMKRMHDAEQAMQAIFRHLSPIQRTVFVLREALGYSIAETAGWLSTTEGAVKAALYRARQSLGAVRDEIASEEAVGQSDSEEQLAASHSVQAMEEGRVAELVQLLYGESYWTVQAAQGYRIPFKSGITYDNHAHSMSSLRMCA